MASNMCVSVVSVVSKCIDMELSVYCRKIMPVGKAMTMSSVLDASKTAHSGFNVLQLGTDRVVLYSSGHMGMTIINALTGKEMMAGERVARVGSADEDLFFKAKYSGIKYVQSTNGSSVFFFETRADYDAVFGNDKNTCE